MLLVPLDQGTQGNKGRKGISLDKSYTGPILEIYDIARSLKLDRKLVITTFDKQIKFYSIYLFRALHDARTARKTIIFKPLQHQSKQAHKQPRKTYLLMQARYMAAIQLMWAYSTTALCPKSCL